MLSWEVFFYRKHYFPARWSYSLLYWWAGREQRAALLWSHLPNKWAVLELEHRGCRDKLNGSQTLFVLADTFYITRLLRCWENGARKFKSSLWAFFLLFSIDNLKHIHLNLDCSFRAEHREEWGTISMLIKPTYRCLLHSSSKETTCVLEHCLILIIDWMRDFLFGKEKMGFENRGEICLIWSYPQNNIFQFGHTTSLPNPHSCICRGQLCQGAYYTSINMTNLTLTEWERLRTVL